MTTTDFDKVEDLEQFLADRHMNGFWNSPRATEEVRPCLWKWPDIYRGLVNAAALVPMDRVAMRTIQLRNPGLDVGMTKTLHFSVQILQPGERTKAHRNLVGETRFVVKAPRGAVFIVDGEPFPMEEGDLISTPNWSWHDHYNGGDEPAIWLDGMDTRLVAALGKPLNEPFPELHQPVEKPEGYTLSTLGHAKPAWLTKDRDKTPFQYKWSETAATLNALRATETEIDPFDGIHLTYTNPLNGGPTFPTYSCEIQMLPPSFEGVQHRHNSTTLYHAFRGDGATVVNGERIEWSQGDIFVVPPWIDHQHLNPSQHDSILYSITDKPSLTALGLYLEETASTSGEQR